MFWLYWRIIIINKTSIKKLNLVQIYTNLHLNHQAYLMVIDVNIMYS